MLTGAVMFSQSNEGNGVTFGIKANALVNTSQLGELKGMSDINKMGFQIGVTGNILLGDKYAINPTLYYTKLDQSRIDLPILFSYNIAGNVHLLAGPSLQYGFANASKDYDEMRNEIGTAMTDPGAILNYGQTASNIAFKMLSKFTIGVEVGADYRFEKFTISARYNTAISKQYTDVIKDVTANAAGIDVSAVDMRVSTTPSYVSLGLGYNF